MSATLITGAAGTCGNVHPDGKVCYGNLSIADTLAEIWEIECDACSYLAAVAAVKVDARTRSTLRIRQSDLPDVFIGRTFEQDLENQSTLEGLRTWIGEYDRTVAVDDRLAQMVPAPAIWGEPGRGKTHLMVALCVRLIRECEVSVLYRPVRGLLRDLQRFEDEAARQRSWNRAVNVDVLALDDLGAQQATDWKHDVLADLVDERYAAQRPVVLATNYPPSMWESVMDARTRSRLAGMTFALELRGRDRRTPTTTEEQQ